MIAPDSPPADASVETRAGETSPANTQWWSVLIAAVFVIAVTTAISYALSEDPAERGDVSAVGEARTDRFDRPRDDNGLGSGPIGTWVNSRGAWGLQLAAAYIVFPDPGRSIAIVDAGVDAVRVQASVFGRQVCGVVARYESAEQYVALIRVAEFGVWNIVEVVDGQDSVLGTLPDVDEPGVVVALAVDDNMIQAEVGLKKLVIPHPVRPAGRSIGLIGQATSATECSWDDVTVQTMK